MSQEKLTIVPITLQPLKNDALALDDPDTFGMCTIKTAKAQISFSNGMEDRIIQTVMRELKHL